MAFLSAYRSFGISLHGQFRCLMISSWLKSSAAITYIPGEYVKIKKAAKFSHLKSAKEKEIHAMGTVAPKATNFDENYSHNSYFDANDMNSSDFFDRTKELLELEDTNNCSLDIMECTTGSKFQLLLDDTQDAGVMKITDTDNVMESRIKQDAEKTAIELLAARAFTALELRKKLRGKKYPLDVVDSVIASIEERGLLNDGLYAESFSRSRWLSSTWGPRRIKRALLQKGVSQTAADKAAKEVFEEDDDAGGGKCQSTQHGMSKPALEHLYVQASKQWLRGQNSSLETRKSRIVRWLQYRGFSWGVTSIILRRLQSEYPP